MGRRRLWVIILVIGLVAYPPIWYPQALRIKLSQWFGPTSYRTLPESQPVKAIKSEDFCPPDLVDWRKNQTIEDVDIKASRPCIADNPFEIASFVRGTNNVSRQTLLKSGLTPDAIEKGQDLDNDGDPDEIHIRLELAELNGFSTEADEPTTQYMIAPGINPGIWVFSPKFVGMSRENFESKMARASLRLPSPVIRVEQGDRIKITLENTHYMPHTLHLHGSDHGFVTASGQGNDGVPITSEKPVMPGESRTYELNPRHAGTTFYHCHVQPHVHMAMGLQGMFIVEENRPNNWLQTMNIGAGFVRVSSAAVKESYDQEYDLHYSDFDKQLNERLQLTNDPRVLARRMHREYDVTESTVDYFMLNGKSFPYTFRESLIVTKPNENLKLRVLNGGSKGISLHTHGHKFSVSHRDGVAVPTGSSSLQDVIWLSTAQRVDLSLSTINDGLHSYGAGIWPYHDHQSHGVTTDGIGPGGNISAIVYEEYMNEDGWPQLQGVSYAPYFTADYYNKQLPVWQTYAPDLFSDPDLDNFLMLRIVILSLAIGMLLAIFISGTRRED